MGNIICNVFVAVVIHPRNYLSKCLTFKIMPFNYVVQQKERMHVTSTLAIYAQALCKAEIFCKSTTPLCNLKTNTKPDESSGIRTLDKAALQSETNGPSSLKEDRD